MKLPVIALIGLCFGIFTGCMVVLLGPPVSEMELAVTSFPLIFAVGYAAAGFLGALLSKKSKNIIVSYALATSVVFLWVGGRWTYNQDRVIASIEAAKDRAGMRLDSRIKNPVIEKADLIVSAYVEANRAKGILLLAIGFVLFWIAIFFGISKSSENKSSDKKIGSLPDKKFIPDKSI